MAANFGAIVHRMVVGAGNCASFILVNYLAIDLRFRYF
jgi:hypothetical protein